MCYTQYLDRKDGTDPLIRGCISTKTSLLCENRRPAVAGLNWPVLVCCNSNLCNQDTMPTVPTWTIITNKITSTSTAKPSSMRDISSKDMPNQEDDLSRNIPSNTQSATPFSIAAIVFVITSLLIIGIAVVVVIRKQDRLYNNCDYILSPHFKGNQITSSHLAISEDPELQMSLPRGGVNGIYDNKLAANT